MVVHARGVGKTDVFDIFKSTPIYVKLFRIVQSQIIIIVSLAHEVPWDRMNGWL